MRCTFLPQNQTSKESVCLVHEYEFSLFLGGLGTKKGQFMLTCVCMRASKTRDYGFQFQQVKNQQRKFHMWTKHKLHLWWKSSLFGSLTKHCFQVIWGGRAVEGRKRRPKQCDWNISPKGSIYQKCVCSYFVSCQDKFQIWIFWVCLNLYGSRTMLEWGICQECIFLPLVVWEYTELLEKIWLGKLLENWNGGLWLA